MGASSGETDTVLVAIPSPPDKGYDNFTKLRRYSLKKYPGVVGCSDALIQAMKVVPGLSPQRPSDVDKLQHHVQFIVVNLFHVHQLDPTRWIFYSRNKTNYGKGSDYKTKFKLSHEYTVNKVIKFLLSNEYIEHSQFYYERDKPWLNKQSRIRSTQKLIDLIKAHIIEQDGDGDKEWEPEDDWDDYGGEEIIVVKGLKPPKRVVYRMRNGVRKKEKEQPKRKICKTPDTPACPQMRDNLQKDQRPHGEDRDHP